MSACANPHLRSIGRLHTGSGRGSTQGGRCRLRAAVNYVEPVNGYLVYRIKQFRGSGMYVAENTMPLLQSEANAARSRGFEKKHQRKPFVSIHTP